MSFPHIYIHAKIWLFCVCKKMYLIKFMNSRRSNRKIIGKFKICKKTNSFEKMHKSFLMKKCSSPSNEFLLHRWRNKFFFFSNLKKFTSPANKFLLHKCRNNRKMKKYFFFKSEKMHKSFLMSFSYNRKMKR